MGGGKYGVGAERDSRVRADNDQILAFEALLRTCRPRENAMLNNDHVIFAFHLLRGTCSSHRSDRETLSQLSFIP